MRIGRPFGRRHDSISCSDQVEEASAHVPETVPRETEIGTIGIGDSGERNALVRRIGCDAGIVELVSDQAGLNPAENTVGGKPRHAIPEMEFPLAIGCGDGEKVQHRMDHPVRVLEALTQYHVAATLAMDRTGPREGPRAFQEACRGGDASGMKLRITPWKPTAIAFF